MTEQIDRLRIALQDRYVLEGLLDEGGMAMVYRAVDLRHDRQVALKALRPELAAAIGAERFLAEIRTTANLQHPHILPLFDSGEAAGLLYYVMPYVEGESLRERLAREGQLPVGEAVTLARKVAGALQAAHDAGIVHRDVKPGNILLSNGEPLVADFGIALGADSGGGPRLTETGMTVGTPHYMSPEQVTGDQLLGPATDIFALGCVLYETLVGSPPFPGKTAQAVLGNLLIQDAPDVSAGRPAVPPNVDSAIATALEKLPADRFSSAAEFAAALQDPAYRHHSRERPQQPASPRGWKLAAAGLGILATILGGLALWAAMSPDVEPPLFQVPVRFQDDQVLAGTGHFDISQDGSLLVYQGRGQFGTTQLWVRRAEETNATPISGSEGLDPSIVPDIAISPSGQEVGFWRDGSYHVVPVTGGTAVAVADSVWGSASWSSDGESIYLRRFTPSGLTRVSARGGEMEIVTLPDTAAGETGHVWPETLPGGEALIFEARGRGGTRIKAVRLSSGEIVDVGPGRYPRYANGHLLFSSVDGDRLLAAPFDAKGLRTTGDPKTVLDGLREIGSPLAGSVGYAVSRSGILAYAPQRHWQLMRVSPDGASRPLDPEWVLDAESSMTLGTVAPDGSRLALRLGPRGQGDIWVKEMEAGPLTKLTSAEGEERPVSWMDSQTILFLRSGETGLDLWTVRADGVGEPRLLYDHETGIASASLTAEGNDLLFTSAPRWTGSGYDGGEIFSFRPGNDTEATLAVSTPGFWASGVEISPNERMVAYVSSATGTGEVFLRTYPDLNAGRVQISASGGTSPVWSPDGREVFYVNDDAEVMAARVISEDPLRVSRRRLFPLGPGLWGSLNLTPNGTFLMVRSKPELVLVFNWLQMIR